MLQKNKLKKKVDSTEETLGLVVKKQRGDHIVEDPRRGTKVLPEKMIATTANNLGT